MEKLLLNWNIIGTQIEEITSRAFRINQNYVLKKTDQVFDVKQNVGILKALKQASFPVAEVIKTSSGLDYLKVDDSYYTLMKTIQGEHLQVEDVLLETKNSFKVGQVIAELHKALKHIENDFDFYDNDFLQELEGWIEAEIDALGPDYFVTEIIRTYKEQMRETYPKLTRQPIHRDVHLRNMLFDQGQLSGYIDFDISQKNVRMFDLAYFAVGVLSEVFDSTLKTHWRSFFDSLVSGYTSVSKIDDEEEQSIWLLMGSIEILFVAYFNKNDNEALSRSADHVLRWIWTSK